MDYREAGLEAGGGPRKIHPVNQIRSVGAEKKVERMK